MSGCSSAPCHTWQVLSEPCQQQLQWSCSIRTARQQACTQRQEALLTTAASRHCIMLRASQSRLHFSSSALPVALAVVFLAVSTTSAAPAAPVAVPPVLAPGTETNVTTAPAEAPAQAPTAAAEAPAGTPTNPFGDTGFITVQGNKFVDANCKVC